jgi:spore germination protein KB
MKKKANLSTAQVALVAGGSAVVVGFTYMPIMESEMPGHEALLIFLLGFVYITILNLPVLLLSVKMKNMSLNQIVETLAGRVLGKIVIAVVALFLFLTLLTMVSVTTNYITTYILPNTPQWTLLAITLAAVVYAAYKGSGTLGRQAIVIVPIMLITVLLFFLFGLDKMSIRDFLPISEYGDFGTLNKYAFYTASRYSEIYMLLIFGQHIRKRSGTMKAYWLSFAVYAAAITLIVLPTMLVLGINLAKLFLNPYFVYSRQVGGFEFAQRIQSINIFTWYLGAMFRMAVYLYAVSLLLAGIFRKGKYKKLVPPVGAAAFIGCLLPPLNNLFTLVEINNSFAKSIVVAAVVFVIPLLLLILAFIRKKHVQDVQRRLKESIEENAEADREEGREEITDNEQETTPDNEQETVTDNGETQETGGARVV